MAARLAHFAVVEFSLLICLYRLSAFVTHRAAVSGPPKQSEEGESCERDHWSEPYHHRMPEFACAALRQAIPTVVVLEGGVEPGDYRAEHDDLQHAADEPRTARQGASAAPLLTQAHLMSGSGEQARRAGDDRHLSQLGLATGTPTILAVRAPLWRDVPKGPIRRPLTERQLPRGGAESMRYDKSAMKNVVCPLCKQTGTLQPIRPGRRLRAGPWSYARLLFKAYECRACRALLSNEQVIQGQRAA